MRLVVHRKTYTIDISLFTEGTDKTAADCSRQSYRDCSDVDGPPGNKGHNGGNGGDAGLPGIEVIT